MSDALLVATISVVALKSGVTSSRLNVHIAESLSPSQQEHVDAVVAALEPAVEALSAQIARLVSGEDDIVKVVDERTTNDGAARERRN